MRIRELMEKLAQEPAGANVVVTGMFSDDELQCAITDSQIVDDDTVLNRLEFKPCDTEFCDDNLVLIYIE